MNSQIMVDGKKKCSRCLEWFPATMKYFYGNKNMATGFTSVCRNCNNRDLKQYRQLPKVKECRKKYRQRPEVKLREKLHRKTPAYKFARRKVYLKITYNITIEDYSNLLKEQKNLCAICGESFDINNSSHIDHDHKTGKVRGLLCCNCNFGLGRFKDNMDILKNAIKYLKNTNQVDET